MISCLMLISINNASKFHAEVCITMALLKVFWECVLVIHSNDVSVLLEDDTIVDISEVMHILNDLNYGCILIINFRKVFDSTVHFNFFNFRAYSLHILICFHKHFVVGCDAFWGVS